MGGYGSTRWKFHTKKDTVEDCRVLSVFDMKREGLLEPGPLRSGRWVWRNAYTNEIWASIGYKLLLGGNGNLSFLRLQYTITRWDNSKQDMDYTVFLKNTACHFGGVRWWFICPLVVNGRNCKRRVGKLYLLSGGRYFGCRHCYDLTYQSSQESDKRVNALKRLGSFAIMEGINNGEVDLLMGLKALPDDIWRP